MNCHGDILRPAHDAKEMSSHLQPTQSLDNSQNVSVVKHMQNLRILVPKLTQSLHSDDNSTKRLSSKTHAEPKNTSSKIEKHATNSLVHVVVPLSPRK